MTTHYLALRPLQEPYDLGGLDDNGRAQCAFNVLALKRPSGTFVQELVAVLEAAGVGVEGETIFGTSTATMPEQGGPYLAVRSTGGTAPIGTHNDGAGAYRQPGALFIAHAPRWADAEAMAQAAFNALLEVRNQAVAVPA